MVAICIILWRWKPAKNCFTHTIYGFNYLPVSICLSFANTSSCNNVLPSEAQHGCALIHSTRKQSTTFHLPNFCKANIKGFTFDIPNPKWALHSERRMAPPLLPSSTISLVPGHVGLRQHPSTVGALPPLCSVYTLGARGLAPCSASCPPLASLASSLLPAIPARASHVLLCLAMLFLETSLPHVPHIALLGSSVLSPMHLFSWFFQLLSEAKVALHLLHVNVFRFFSCILTWWILSPPFDLHTFPQSG